MNATERQALVELADEMASAHSVTMGEYARRIRGIIATFDAKPSTRYPWADAPEQAMWAAIDEDGSGFFFISRPKLGNVGNCWIPADWNEQIWRTEAKSRDTDWRDSLEARPT